MSKRKRDAVDRSITFKTMTEEDLEFSYSVYADSRKEEMDMVAEWTDEQKEQFLRQQFHAQHTYYQQQYGDAHYLVILKDKTPVGRLYVHRWDDEIRVIDIALLHEHRGAGIGGQIMSDILDEGHRTGKKVSIHVEQNNRALHLYERLGFQRVGEVSVYWLMEWKPPQEQKNVD